MYNYPRQTRSHDEPVFEMIRTIINILEKVDALCPYESLKVQVSLFNCSWTAYITKAPYTLIDVRQTESSSESVTTEVLPFDHDETLKENMKMIHTLLMKDEGNVELLEKKQLLDAKLESFQNSM